MKKRFLLPALLMLMLAAALSAPAEGLRVDFYDMGKADAMLITTPAGVRILIDTGTNKGGKQLVQRFETDGIDRIDYLIVTHYDKDHVGGADKVLEGTQVSHVIMPVYDKESKQHAQFLEALGKQPQIAVQRMETGAQAAYVFDDGTQMSVTAAHRESYGPDEENDFSLAVRLTYGDTRFLFAGDAETPRQSELLEEGDVRCDVLKVPYHGRLVASSQSFLTAASPKIAYITDSDEEPASQTVIDILQELGAHVYCAREDGSVTVVSDGRDVKTLE